MNKRITTRDVSGKRLLGIDEASEYIGLGRNKCKEYCTEIGAVRRIGSRVLYDRNVIDRELDRAQAAAAVTSK